MNINNNAQRQIIDKNVLNANLLTKLYNNYWLGRMVEFKNKNLPLKNIAELFPYCIAPKSRVTSIFDLEFKSIELGNPQTDQKSSFPSYIIMMPCVPDLNAQIPGTRIQNIITSIETDAFGTDHQQSRINVAARATLLIALNTFYSIDGTRNFQFRKYINELPQKLPQTSLPVRIIPFFWSPWKTIDTYKCFGTVLFKVDKCYMLAKSYFDTPTINAIDLQINLAGCFGPDRSRPITSIIPFQDIREKLIHSPEIEKISSLYFQQRPNCAQYAVSLDSDFVSLKSDEWGFLSYYDALVDRELTKFNRLPGAMSTGYLAPNNEPYELLKFGIELDREIRHAVGRILPPAVYMPEPNFAFLISATKFLKTFSWKGGKDMTTESRRLISNAIASKLIDPNSIVYTKSGGIQTEIDDEWRTQVIKKYPVFDKKLIAQKDVLVCFRGLHQSYCDPQIWSNNIYGALGRTIHDHMKNAISPMKKLRDTFDPYILMVDLKPGYGNFTKNTFDKGLAFMREFTPKMLDTYNHRNHLNQNSESFAHACSPEGGNTKKFLIELFKVKANALFGALEILKAAGYSPAEIEKIVKLSQSTGEAIRDFLSSKSK